MKRLAFKLSAFTAVSLVATSADAVILYDREARNLAAPPAPYRAAWELQGQYSGFVGTPISPSHFVTAAHVGGVGSFTFAGQTYGEVSSVTLPGTDLVVRTIDTQNGTRPFPRYAPLWDPAVDGSEVGRPLVVFGRGTPRGAAIVAPLPTGPGATPPAPAISISLTGDDSSSPQTLAAAAAAAGPAPTTPGGLRGWAWGPSDALQSWGTNVVDAIAADATYGDLLSFDFSSRGTPDEAALSSGDSSGGVFLFSNGQWKLAGVNLGVDGPWSTSEPGPYANASIFDARGIYVGNASQHSLVPYADEEIAGSSYASRIGAHISAIRNITGIASDGTGGAGPGLVPEPTAVVGMGVALAITRRRGRSVTRE